VIAPYGFSWLCPNFYFVAEKFLDSLRNTHEKFLHKAKWPPLFNGLLRCMLRHFFIATELIAEKCFALFLVLLRGV